MKHSKERDHIPLKPGATTERLMDRYYMKNRVDLLEWRSKCSVKGSRWLHILLTVAPISCCEWQSRSWSGGHAWSNHGVRRQAEAASDLWPPPPGPYASSALAKHEDVQLPPVPDSAAPLHLEWSLAGQIQLMHCINNILSLFESWKPNLYLTCCSWSVFSDILIRVLWCASWVNQRVQT
jgi:hypothetical protein